MATDSAAIVLSAPPRLVEAIGLFEVQELASHVSLAIDRDVEFVAAGSSEEFVRDSLRDAFDLVLDEAHVAAWRIVRFQHDPLVRVAGQRQSVVLAKVDDPDIFSAADLSGRILCTPSVLDAGLRQFLSRWQRSFARPQLKIDTIEVLENGKCDAIIISMALYKLRPFDPGNRILTLTEAMPGLTITASPRIPADMRQRIVMALLDAQASSVMRPFASDSGDGEALQALLSDFEDLHQLLPPDFME